MDAVTTSLLVAVAVFLSSLVGMSLHRVVPDGHLSQETRSVILLGTGTLSLLASLVLGLLVSTAKSSYDATETRIQNYAAGVGCGDEPAAVARQIHGPRRNPRAARTMPVTALYLEPCDSK